MSISAIHSEAARVNGAQSHGPATAEGKSKSSQNSRKHGILTHIALLPHEDQEEFSELLNSFLNEHQPGSPTEVVYIREMADAEWRLARIRNYSLTLQLKQMATLPEPDSAEAAAEAFLQLAESADRSLNTLLRYEAHFRRQFDRSLNQLLKLRATHAPMQIEKLPNEPKPDAVVQPAAIEKLPNEPKRRKIGRNTFCPCKSGKKYKRCCGLNAPPIIHTKAA